MGLHPIAPARRAAADDSGFTLVEAVVALFVLATIFTALAVSAMGSMRASMNARVEQQALDFATEALEKARSADYYTLANVSADMAGDARVTACGSSSCIDPGTGAQEPLVLSSTGTVTPHVTAVSTTLSNEVPLTLSTYVTRPADSTADYKRVTVVASWKVAGLARQRSVSSLVTITTRGLPLPIFKLTPVGGTSISVNPDTNAPFAFELTNQGAPDRWNLTMTGSGASDWEFFRDDGDGIWEASSIDEPLTNTNSPADAIVDTGRIDPTESIVFWAVRSVDDSAAAGDYWSTIRAVSASQPTAATSTATVDLLVKVVADGTSVVVNPGSGQQAVVPTAPQYLQVTTGDGQLAVAWQAPISEGSAAISDYVVSYKVAGSATWTVFADGVSTALSTLITGLTNGSTYDIAVAAKNSAGLGPVVTAQGSPVSGTAYVTPVKCAAPSAVPAGSANNGYTLRQYALHNRSAANPSWPGTGTIASTTTIGQGLPLSAAVDGAQVPVDTNLPVYSGDIVSTERGRILLAGGSFSTSDTTRVVDWRSTTGGKAYKGTAVLMLWVAPVSGDDVSLPAQMKAQLYIRKSTGALQAQGSTVNIDLAAGTFGASGCTGWRQVWMTFGVNQSSLLGANEYIGVRLWNSSTGSDGKMARFRVAYDVVGDFPSYLTVPEKP